MESYINRDAWIKIILYMFKRFSKLKFCFGKKKTKAVFEYLIYTARLELILSFICLKDFQNSSFVLEKKKQSSIWISLITVFVPERTSETNRHILIISWNKGWWYKYCTYKLLVYLKHYRKKIERLSTVYSFAYTIFRELIM